MVTPRPRMRPWLLPPKGNLCETSRIRAVLGDQRLWAPHGAPQWGWRERPRRPI